MEKNDAVKKHYCELCNYATNRKYDLKRHHNAKHITNIINEKNVPSNEKNVPSNEKNVPPNEKMYPHRLFVINVARYIKQKNV
jgi:hypothetical protein